MIGRQFGSYEVVAKLGEGGMGEVYRARDHKLNRDVALKILPDILAGDPDRLARFQREAQVLASLNHPNIAAIYGLEADALVLELVEGPTLADRIAAGPIPVQEALAIARQIADALTAAHDAGVIHRDLKPANVKVREDGTAKVLDFGLAKALSPDAGLGTQSSQNSPTLTAHATAMGTIIGTAAYMAPEQARGKSVDRRADLWAFGVVLYEMLTGRRAFQGAEVTDVLAAVIRDTPSLDALPRETPASVRRLLHRTLEKDRSRRLDSMTAARLELDDVEPSAQAAVTGPAPASRWRLALVALIAAIAGAMAAAGAVWRAMQPAPTVIQRLTITPTTDAAIAIETNHNDVALTPDGTRLVYFSRAGTENQMVVRRLDSFEPTVLRKLGEDPRSIVISPDGQWIAYQSGAPTGSGAALYKAPLAGGSPVRLTGIVSNMRGASWSADGHAVVFATVARETGLFRIAAGGGEPELLTAADPKQDELDHLWPHLLPDSRHALFTIARPNGSFDVALVSLDTKTWKVLLKEGTFPRYVKTGHIVFARSANLRAVPFDLRRLEVTGDEVEVLQGLVTKESGAADFSISDTGTLAFLPGLARRSSQQLAWKEPNGPEKVLGIPVADYGDIRVSPDGRFAAAIVVGTTATLWLLDLEREVSSRLAPATMLAGLPVWSHDSRRVAFWSRIPERPTDPPGIFIASVTGATAPQRLTTAPPGIEHRPGSWTRDGRALLFTEAKTGFTVGDIMQVTIDDKPTITPVLAGPALDGSPALSPDGRWLVHISVEDQPRLFIRPFPDVNADRIPVTAEPGSVPMWSYDGRMLYFRNPGLTTQFAISVDGTGRKLFIGKPTAVMSLRNERNAFFNMALPPVRGRFLSPVFPADELPFNEYRIVLNWTEELNARISQKK